MCFFFFFLTKHYLSNIILGFFKNFRLHFRIMGKNQDILRRVVTWWGFPGSASVEEPACQCRRCER